MEELEFDHQPCHDKLKALKAKFRQRQAESSMRLVNQMKAMEHGLSLAFQAAWNAGYRQAELDMENPDGLVE